MSKYTYLARALREYRVNLGTNTKPRMEVLDLTLDAAEAIDELEKRVKALEDEEIFAPITGKFVIHVGNMLSWEEVAEKLEIANAADHGDSAAIAALYITPLGIQIGWYEK